MNIITFLTFLLLEYTVLNEILTKQVVNTAFKKIYNIIRLIRNTYDERSRLRLNKTITIQLFFLIAVEHKHYSYKNVQKLQLN